MRTVTCLMLLTVSFAHAADAPSNLPSSGPATAPATTRAAVTQHDYLRAMTQFNRRTLSEPFRQLGPRDATWDADAVRFLDDVSFYMSDSYARRNPVYRRPDAPSIEALRMLGTALRAKGLDDPLFDYSFSDLLRGAGYAVESQKINATADERLMNSRYPVNRAAYAAWKKWQQSQTDADKDAAFEKFRDLLGALLLTWEWRDLDRRIVYDHVRGMIAQLPLEKHRALLEASQAVEGAEPWLVRVLAGDYHARAAWASQRSRDGDPGDRAEAFAAGLRRARDELTAAWTLRPEYPEAAARMIDVAIGGQGAELGEDPRQWFNRAVAAQFDYVPAYVSYAYALHPHWGGSVGQMQAFARECLDTKRFDTEVPLHYAAIVEQIAQEENEDGGVGYWLRPEIYPAIKEMSAGYRAALPETNDRARKYFDSYEAAVAWRARQFADAVKILDALGGDPPRDPWKRLRVLPRLAMSHAYAVADPDVAAAVKAAEAHAAESRFDDAITGYRAAVDTFGAKKSAHFLKSRLKQLEWHKQFESGEWVDIKPADADLAGWEALLGDVRVAPDGAVVAKAVDADGADLTFQGIFMPPRFEIEAIVVLPPATVQPMIAMSLVSNDPIEYDGVALRVFPDKVMFENEWLRPREPKELRPALAGENTLRLRQWDDTLKFDFNDQSLPRLTDTAGRLTGPAIYFTLGTNAAPGVEFRIKSIRLRKLDEEPPRE